MRFLYQRNSVFKWIVLGVIFWQNIGLQNTRKFAGGTEGVTYLGKVVDNDNQGEQRQRNSDGEFDFP